MNRFIILLSDWLVKLNNVNVIIMIFENHVRANTLKMEALIFCFVYYERFECHLCGDVYEP